MKKVCYIIEMNSSVGGLLERLEDMGAHWNALGVGEGFMEVEILAPAEKIVEVEEEMAFYV